MAKAVESIADECNVSDWKDIVAISAGYGGTVGLKSDGTLESSGEIIGDIDANTIVILSLIHISLPDLLHATAKSLVDAHFSSGAFISISDNLDKMPYYAKFMETLPETEREELVSQRKCADGKIYSPPVYGTGTVNNMYTWSVSYTHLRALI